MNDISKLNAALSGRYEIDREIGAGGMATVYLARDLRHERPVALKVLKPELGAVLGVERFLGEIKVTANLQHPTLLPLFDSGSADGLLFYVMPYVDGESLRARLDREKHLPVQDAVQIAAAVAAALDYAHRQGVIHRDLKPENILLREGQPLVADFGIALAVSNAGGGRITQTGLSLGTPQYMSPEQATGDRAVDGRTDIYSLGAVTYEMLTGEPPHVASTSQAIMARLLTEKPRDVRAIRPSVPEHVEAAVEHALEKLPADRFATAREFADAVTGRVRVVSAGMSAAVHRPRSRRERWLAVALAFVGTVLVLTSAVTIRLSTRHAEAPTTMFEIPTPNAGGPQQLSISPDGRNVAFVLTDSVGGKARLWIRPLGSVEAHPIAGSEDGHSAFWSPDSRKIGFVAAGQLRHVAITGGAVTNVCNVARQFRGASWGADNVIVFAMDGTIHRVPSAGGTPLALDVQAPGASGWAHPSFLPDGVHFLVLASDGMVDVRGLYVASLRGGRAARVDIGVQTSKVLFAPPNQLLFVREGTLYAREFDPRTTELAGEETRIAENVGVGAANGLSAFAVSANGVLVFRTAANAESRQLRWYGRNGEPGAALGEPQNVREFSLSPDGKRVAMTVVAAPRGVMNIWTLDLASGIASPLTSDSSGVSGVLWSPDSRSLTFRTGTMIAANGILHSRPVGGSVDSLVLEADGAASFAEDYSRDRSTLLVHRHDTLFAVPLTGSRRLVALAAIKGVDEVRLSPDGSHVSYTSNAGIGRWQVYVASYPTLDNRTQVSARGGAQPRWRGDGSELYFLDDGGNVMAAAAKSGSRGVFQAPTILFQSPLRKPSAVLDEFDVSRDGQRFLFAESPNTVDAGARPLTVILNWTNALKKK